MIGNFGFGFGGNSSSFGGAPPASPDIDPTTIDQQAGFSCVARAKPLMVIDQTASVTIVAGNGAVLVDADIDFNPDFNVTLGGTMRAAGTSPPVVTLTAGTGSLTYATGCPGLRVEIDSVAGGTARGQATFRISYNSGDTWAHSGVTTAATYSIPDGPAAGNVVNFPTGTYGTTQSWEGTVASIVTSDANGFTFAIATAAQQPVYRRPSTGNPYTLHVTHYLHCTDAGAVALWQNAVPFHLFGRVTYAVVDAATRWFSACDSGSNTAGQRLFGNTTTGSGRRAHSTLTDAPATIGPSERSTTDFVADTPETECWYTNGAGTTISLSVDDDAADPNAAAHNPATTTPDRLTIGARGDAGPDLAHNGRIYRIVMIAAGSDTIDASERSGWFSELAA